MKNPGAVHLIEDASIAASVMNPMRRSILEALREPDSAAGIARRLNVPRQKLNYHIRKLEAAGLVERVGERQARGFTEVVMQSVAHAYLVSPSTLGSLEADPKDLKDRASSAYLLAAAGRLIRNVGTLRRTADEQGKRLATLTVESTVTFETAEDQRAFGDDLTRTIAALVEKYHAPDAESGRSFGVLAAVSQQPRGIANEQQANREES